MVNIYFHSVNFGRYGAPYLGVIEVIKIAKADFRYLTEQR